MIGKLTGRFGGLAEGGNVLIEVMGVGYLARVPAGAIPHIQQSGESISLFIHTAVREDAIDLYGFVSEEELGFFKQLMSVSGIGPKTALGILNVSDVTTLKRGIARGDAAALTKVFGIGKKNAERIVVELKDKMVFGTTSESTVGAGSDEALEALMALGYSAQEARKALKEIGDVPETTREKIAAALKNLGSQAKAL